MENRITQPDKRFSASQLSQIVQPAQNKMDIFVALKYALISFLHPKVWLALMVPVITLVLGMIFFGAFLWSFISELITQVFSRVNMIQNFESWMTSWSGLSVGSTLIAIATFFTVLAFAGVFSLIVSLIIVNSMLVKYVQKKCFPQLVLKGVSAGQDIKNTLLYVCLLIITWLIGLPLWVFPPVALIWQSYWTAFFLSKTVPFDTLSDYADNQELKILLKSERKNNFKMGLVCAIVNYIPGISLILPIFSILWFSHYNFLSLTEIRKHNEMG